MQDFEPAPFKLVIEDAKKVVAYATKTLTIKLGDGIGVGKPEITDELITLNGWKAKSESCETFWLSLHDKLEEWQDKNDYYLLPPGKSKPRLAPDMTVIPEAPHYLFSFCKTNRNPYDLVITALLIVAKHHLGDALFLGSDGDEKEWEPAKKLCQVVLGYGGDFSIETESKRSERLVSQRNR